MENSIEVIKLNKSFGERGISNVSFNIRKGHFHALIGENGAGKTTIIRSILRLYQEFGGKVLINGINTSDSKAFKSIGYIGENAIFPSEFTLKEYLYWVGKLANRNPQDVISEINELSIKFELQDLINKKPTRFSSGQKQKVMLMKTIIEKADVIIMDEPTANLDPTARILFFNEIEKLNKEGKTIFISSHNLDEIDKKINWVTVIKDGKIIYDRSKSKVQSLMKIFKENSND